ncbi:MAG: hypothetical protein KAH03_05025 [Cocleimonas sp.]|nr:hypothetical protein [Cocleimonas sp.]
MISVNNLLVRKKKGFFFSITLFSSLFLLSACSSNVMTIAKTLRGTPSVTESNMTDAITCMGQALKKGRSDTAYILLVRKINDGTVKDSVYQDSPLSDSGRIQMQNVLSDHLYPHVGLVIDTFPLMFAQTGKEEIGLNRFGLPSQQNQQAFMLNYAHIIQNARRAKNAPLAKNIVPLIINGSFTRFDTDNIAQKGYGQNMGSRTRRLAENETDNIWRKASGQVDFGRTSSAKALSLVINLVDPRNNLVVSSQSLDLIFYRENKTFRLRVGLGEGYYGISKNEIRVEGIHSAQKALVDAAALWLLNKAYGGQNDFSSCFNNAHKNITITPSQVQPKKSVSDKEIVQRGEIAKKMNSNVSR